MALITGKTTLDDTVPLICSVETAQNVGDHVSYEIKVQRGIAAEKVWTVNKRYSDFVALDTCLKTANIDLPLPPKKVFGNFDREFVADRKNGLQTYLEAILRNLLLASSAFTKRFLDEGHYSRNFQEEALQHVSMFFRSEPKYEVIEPLPDIGWRIRKQYFLVKCADQPKLKQVLSWCNYGPDKFLQDKDLTAIFKLFSNFQHPYIYPVGFGYANESGGLTIRHYNEQGSFRDNLCRAKPKGHCLKKYGNPKTRIFMQLPDVKLFGRQILETLKFLHDKGVPYGHLHAGNILLHDGKCKLTELENWFLGLPAYYRPYYTQFKKINTLESIDVYSFGQLLYELSTGVQLGSPTCDVFPPSLPPEVRSVLESILTQEACKNGLPSVTDLLQHTLFCDVHLPSTDKPAVKIPSKLKEAIKLAKEQMEKRLKEEQKAIHTVRRRSKAQQFHMSEEEKKKRRKNKKKSLADSEEGSGSSKRDSNPPTSPGPSSTSSTPATPTAPTAPTAPAAPDECNG
ncbi:PX domain-containing protein kinase-like protein [Lingula anatina]|uniref:PX domain-containing protein kinase-like protein n=1 Tax=Lingula anatina TaxID=7574 RepID=A0A1S3K5R6_LINAN|nr:PX domain-containing protein kinase-like protein [Lingula anatina]|eukprot:XP_013417774.1 PX domain-containing protein kinase-like protein [Lingula anatina]